MRWPIRNQVLIPLAASLVASTIALSAASAWLAARWTRRQVDEQVSRLQKTISARRFPLTDSVLEQMAGLSGNQFVLVEPNGAVRAASSDRMTVSSLLARLVETGRSDTTDRVEANGVVYYHRVVDVASNSYGDEVGQLHVFIPSASLTSDWRRAVWPPVLVGAFAVLAVVVVVCSVLRRVAIRLSELQTGLSSLAEGDYTPLDVPARDDELRELVVAVNHTAKLLADYEESIRKRERHLALATFGSSIAHELRNAATGCRMAIDLLKHKLSHTSTGSGSDEIQVAQEQLQRMEAFLERFLRICRSTRAADGGATVDWLPDALVETSGGPTSLREICESAVQQLQPLADRNGVNCRVDLSGAEGVLVRHARAWEQALANLLRNAIDAASETQSREVAQQLSSSATLDGRTPTVWLRVRAAPDVASQFVQIEVSDNGFGPPPGIAQKIFDPFVTGKQSGVGLGLAVVQSVAQLCGGEVRWVRTNGVTQFVLQIPLSDGSGVKDESRTSSARCG